MYHGVTYPKNHFAVCIGRSFGSGGHKIAQRLQERLQVDLYDKEILDKAAEDSNIRKELFERADERSRFEIPLVVGGTLGMPNAFYMYANNYLSDEHLFSLQAETIQRLASRQSGIFVGRCADYVLQAHPSMVSIFISSDMEHRAQEVMTRLGLSTIEEARSQLEKIDKNRREYYNYYTSRRWGRADNYDLCLKLPSIGIDYAVDVIIGLMKEKGIAVV